MVPDTVMAALMTFASVYTGLPEAPVLPTVQSGPVVSYARAQYLKNERIILLGEPCDWERLDCQALLVHELVHHLQNADGQLGKQRCISEIEFPAYQTQAAWVAMHGVEHPGEYLEWDLGVLLHMGDGTCAQ